MARTCCATLKITYIPAQKQHPSAGHNPQPAAANLPQEWGRSHSDGTHQCLLRNSPNRRGLCNTTSESDARADLGHK